MCLGVERHDPASRAGRPDVGQDQAIGFGPLDDFVRSDAVGCRGVDDAGRDQSEAAALSSSTSMGERAPAMPSGLAACLLHSEA
jgi:hypothetical protein